MKRYSVLLAVLAASLGACSATEKSASLVCPIIEIDRTTATQTRFRDGPGRDITDVDLTAEIQGYHGECGYSTHGVDVSFMVRFGLTRGPAAAGRSRTDFEYFVAVSHLVPATAGHTPDRTILTKQNFTIQAEFPPGVENILHRDEEVEISIPLQKDDIADNYIISIGLQLTPDQLRYNRSHSL